MHRVTDIMNKKEQIQKIKQENPNMGYKSIAKKVGCAHNTVRYHLDPNQKEAIRKRMQKIRNSQHPLYRKLIGFCSDYGNHNARHNRTNMNKLLPFHKVLEKIGENPKCYLTGENIDILEMSTYSLDHKIPLSQGGQSSLENMGITTRQANACKNGMSPKQFFEFCKKVLENQGYKIIEPDTSN